MPGLTKVFDDTTSNTVTMQRPTYTAFRDIALKVSALMEVEPEAALTAPEFEEVLQACTSEDITPWLEEADYQQAVHLWDAIIEYCEFDSFFAERQKRHFENSKARLEREVDLQAAQIARMKKSGVLPETFSLESVMSAETSATQNLLNSLSSQTTTPASTGGRENASKTRTSGSSSGTTQGPRGSGKRSRN